jgi:hypothetical protein
VLGQVEPGQLGEENLALSTRRVVREQSVAQCSKSDPGLLKGHAGPTTELGSGLLPVHPKEGEEGLRAAMSDPDAEVGIQLVEVVDLSLLGDRQLADDRLCYACLRQKVAKKVAASENFLKTLKSIFSIDLGV